MTRWHAYRDALEYHFNPQCTVPDWEKYMHDRKRLSERTRSSTNCTIDIPYGNHTREKLDIFFPSTIKASSVVVYLHGGYWRMGDKSSASMFAEPFVQHGIAVFIPNYRLCPEATLDEVVQSAFKALRWIGEYCSENALPAKMLVCGHSAGAHIAAMTIGENWNGSAKFSGLGLFGGIFDIEPTIYTTVNKQLHIDSSMIHRLSPLCRPVVQRIPVLFGVGTQEAEGWAQQSHDYRRHLELHGMSVEWFDLPNENHHSPIFAQINSSYPITARMIEIATDPLDTTQPAKEVS